MLQRFLYTAKVGVRQYRKHGRIIIGGGLEYGVWRHLVPPFFYRNKGVVVAVSRYRRETKQGGWTGCVPLSKRDHPQ